MIHEDVQVADKQPNSSGASTNNDMYNAWYDDMVNNQHDQSEPMNDEQRWIYNELTMNLTHNYKCNCICNCNSDYDLLIRWAW